MSDQPTCETKLLPCPWCGGEPHLVSEIDKCNFGVACDECNVRLGVTSCSEEGYWYEHDTPEDARRAWNTRNGQLQTDIGARKEP